MTTLGEKLSMKYGNSNSRLKDGIYLKELVEDGKAEFTIDTSRADDDIDSDNRIDKVYEYDDFAPFINLDCIHGEGTADDPLATPFKVIKDKMTSLTEDGKVSKMILKHGTGDIVPPTAVIYYHYNSYLEMEEVPFDSSYLRSQQPLRMQLGVGAFYSGFEISLLSMRLFEKSQFLVEPEYAFGSMGVPPRVPKDASILLTIELLKIVDCGAAKEEDLAQEDRDKFFEGYRKAKAFHVLGNDCFNLKNVIGAVDNYKKAEKTLLVCKLENDDEEEKCKRLLIKLYINLCVAYNTPKMNSPEKVCIAAKEAFHVYEKEAKKSAKLYFNLGKAHLSLNDFAKANLNLKKALQLEPQNKDTNQLLSQLAEKKTKYYEHEKISYQKAMGTFKPNEQKIREAESKDANITDEFAKLFKEQLSIFRNGNSSRLQLPAGLTSKEKKICHQLSQELGLNYQEHTVCGKTTYNILKN